MSPFQQHLAALSPYFNIYRQPAVPSDLAVRGAVYLFRHGVLEVSHHDYHGYISPFLDKLHRVRQAGISISKPFAGGKLLPLNDYISWITESHVGLVSSSGTKQSCDLGRSFRQRYSHWLKVSDATTPDPVLHVSSDDAFRCRASAVAFATAFSGESRL
jgi:hypothetical protein